jgi:hypothetical protein
MNCRSFKALNDILPLQGQSIGGSVALLGFEEAFISSLLEIDTELIEFEEITVKILRRYIMCRCFQP